MAEGVAACALGEAGPRDRFLDGALDERFVDVVPPFLPGLGVAPTPLLRTPAAPWTRPPRGR